MPAEEAARDVSSPSFTAKGEGWERTPWLPSALIHQWTRLEDEAQELRFDPEHLRTVDKETVTLTLTEAVKVAVANNPRIAAQGLVPVSVKQEVLKARARYDSFFSFDLSKDLRQQPTGSVLSGADALKTK
jgi:hypothetical protein